MLTLCVLSRRSEEYSERVLQLLEHNTFRRLESESIVFEYPVNYPERDTILRHQIDRALRVRRDVATIAFVIEIMMAERKYQTTAS
jgi:hypothetical protein